MTVMVSPATTTCPSTRLHHISSAMAPLSVSDFPGSRRLCEHGAWLEGLGIGAADARASLQGLHIRADLQSHAQTGADNPPAGDVVQRVDGQVRGGRRQPSLFITGQQTDGLVRRNGRGAMRS